MPKKPNTKKQASVLFSNENAIEAFESDGQGLIGRVDRAFGKSKFCVTVSLGGSLREVEALIRGKYKGGRRSPVYVTPNSYVILEGRTDRIMEIRGVISDRAHIEELIESNHIPSEISHPRDYNPSEDVGFEFDHSEITGVSSEPLTRGHQSKASENSRNKRKTRVAPTESEEEIQFADARVRSTLYLYRNKIRAVKSTAFTFEEEEEEDSVADAPAAPVPEVAAAVVDSAPPPAEHSAAHRPITSARRLRNMAALAAAAAAEAAEAAAIAAEAAAEAARIFREHRERDDLSDNAVRAAMGLPLLVSLPPPIRDFTLDTGDREWDEIDIDAI